MSVRAKFKLTSVTDFGSVKKYSMNAVCDSATEENKKFQKYTPNGTIEIHVDNKNVNFVVGKEYYVDFTDAE